MEATVASGRSLLHGEHSCLSLPSLLLIGDPSDADRPFVVDFDTTFAAALASARRSTAAPLAPVTVVAAFERVLRSLSSSNKYIQLVSFAALERLWHTATLRLLRHIVHTHAASLAAVPGVRLDLHELPDDELSNSAERFTQLLLTLSPAVFVMDDAVALRTNLGACAPPQQLWLEVELIVHHIMLRALLAHQAIVNVSEVYIKASGTYGPVQILHEGARASVQAFVIGSVAQLPPSVSDTTPAVPGHEAQLKLWDLHLQVLLHLPLHLRALSLVSESAWAQVAALIELKSATYLHDLAPPPSAPAAAPPVPTESDSSPQSTSQPIAGTTDPDTQAALTRKQASGELAATVAVAPLVDLYCPALLAYLSNAQRRAALLQELRIADSIPGVDVFSFTTGAAQQVRRQRPRLSTPAVREAPLMQALQATEGFDWGPAGAILEAAHEEQEAAEDSIPATQFCRPRSEHLHKLHWHSDRYVYQDYSISL